MREPSSFEKNHWKLINISAKIFGFCLSLVSLTFSIPAIASIVYIQESISKGNLAGAVHAAQDLAIPGHTGQEWRGYSDIHILGDIFLSWNTINQANQNTRNCLTQRL